MTRARYEAMIAATGMTVEWEDFNVSSHPAVRAMRVLARVSFLREILTTNAYGVYRRTTPTDAGATAAPRRAP